MPRSTVHMVEVQIHLVSSKTKLAPIMTMSIPRPELCGALLLSELIDAISPKLDIANYSINYWTDSTIVLSWLARPSGTCNTFVTNRISTINQVIDSKHWPHDASENNPADLGSCGVHPKKLAANSLWWNGPSWLK